MSTQGQPGFYRPLPAVQQDRTREVQRVDEMAGGVYRVCGYVGFTKAGELVAPVLLPVAFTEEPSFSCGGVLSPSSPVQNGRFPTITGLVKDWKFRRRDDTGLRLYVGATFLIVSTGEPELSGTFHYQLEGRALRSPTS